MKNIRILYISAVAVLLFSSCNSLLDIDTKHAIPQDKIQNESGCQSLIVGVYDLMQDPEYAGRNLLCVPDVLGDNCKPSPGATKFVEQYYFQPNYNIDIWESAYKQIEVLNEAVYFLDKLTENENVKYLKGEALFLRAYDYFYLSSIYARMPGHLVDGFSLCVPLVTEPFFNVSGNISSAASVARADVDAVWAQIVKDLESAYSLMNGNDSGKAPYRASAVAAKALLSRVYLYMGNWSDAVTAADFVLENADVQIYSGTKYTDIFSKGSESIWQLHYTESENLASSSLHSTYGTVDNGVRDADGFGDGTGAGDAQLSVSDDFMDIIDKDKDIRFGALRKVHYSGQDLWWTTKFNSWGGSFGLDDVPLIRISEVLLNRAEANAHLSGYDAARTDVDNLRVKRGLLATDVPNSGLLDEILLQRRIEMAFEGHRFFDMKRLGKNISRPEGLVSIEYSDYRVVAPIKADEMDVNKELVNNPGY